MKLVSALGNPGPLDLQRWQAFALSCAAFLGLCACRSDTAEVIRPRLFGGIGAITHPISTKNAVAQRYFNQGLAQVYGFSFAEAVLSFQQAAELDRSSPMPYWGIALAEGPNYNSTQLSEEREKKAFDAAQVAVALAGSAPGEEQAYVNAISVASTGAAEPDEQSLALRYAEAMRGVYRSHPDDPDAAALFAASLMNLRPWHLWALDGSASPEAQEAVNVLESSLRRWPDHIGLNHFYIHAMEGSPYPERAAFSASRLAGLVHRPNNSL